MFFFQDSYSKLSKNNCIKKMIGMGSLTWSSESKCLYFLVKRYSVRGSYLVILFTSYGVGVNDLAEGVFNKKVTIDYIF